MDIARFLDKPAAIVGTTGAGKTFTAKGAVELLLALGRRVIVIDPTGAWYGLRAGADGEASGGFPVLIFGGDHADIPISPDAGERVAEALAGRDVQAIIDTSEMTSGEKTRFLTDFLQKLYTLNKAALHLVVDEADEVCPQNPMPEERRLSGAFDKIVRRGRIKGFRPLMITQRPAVLHKNVLSQIGTLIALKLTSPQDRKAIEDWVKGNADADQARAVMSSLPTLKRGEGWVWSPADFVLERVTFPPIRTFDSSRTPDADEGVVEPALTAVDVDALREAMKPEEPTPLSGRTSSDRIASKVEIEAAEKRGHRRGYKEGHAAGAAEMHDRIRRILVSVLDNEISAPAAGAPATLAAATIPVSASSNLAVAANPVGAVRDLRAGVATLSPSARKIVDAVKSVYPRGLSLVVAARRAGLSSRSSAYRKHMRDAEASPEIADRGDGKFVAVAPPTSVEPGAGTAAFRAMLPPSYARMLDAIEHHRGRPIAKDLIAQQAGVSPTSSGLGAGLRELLALDLIIELDGGFALSPDLLEDE